MVLRFPTSVRNALVDLIRDRFDADAGNGEIRVYTGSQPASANDAPSGTLLVTFNLSDPSFAVGSGGSNSINGTPVTANAVATGTAGWWRGVDDSGDTVVDGNVTASGGGGDLELETVAITSGLTSRITGGGFVAPG